MLNINELPMDFLHIESPTISSISLLIKHQLERIADLFELDAKSLHPTHQILIIRHFHIDFDILSNETLNTVNILRNTWDILSNFSNFCKIEVNILLENKQVKCIVIIALITMTQFSILFPLFVDADKEPKEPKEPKEDKEDKDKRNMMILQYGQTYFGNNYPVENVDWTLEWYDGGVWAIYDSGITLTDGIIAFTEVDGATQYRLNFTDGFNDVSDAPIVFTDWEHFETMYPNGIIGMDLKFLTATVRFEDTSLAIGYALDLYFWDGSNYVYVATEITDGSGVAYFEGGLLVGQYAFNSDYVDVCDVLESTGTFAKALFVDVGIIRELMSNSDKLSYYIRAICFIKGGNVLRTTWDTANILYKYLITSNNIKI